MYQVIRLYSNSERFLLEPLHDSTPNGSSVPINGPHGCLEIERNNSINVTMNVKTSVDFTPKDTVEDIYGILGIINLLRGPYLIVITHRNFVGVVNGCKIWKVTKTKIIPFSLATKLSTNEEQDEEKYVSLLNSVLKLESFYFSYADYDITKTLQQNYLALQNQNPSTHSQSKNYLQADERFFWNKYLQRDFIKNGLDSWVLVVMLGYIEIHQCNINNKQFDFILISRRNIKRAGTRFNMRGIDLEGNVANNVETEQIIDTVHYNGEYRTAYVQTRGSVPIFWQQLPNLKYKPKFTIHNSEQETTRAFRKHFDEQIRIYGRQAVVSLIDHHGGEKTLADIFDSQMRSFDSPMIRFTTFDFHRHCKGMKYQNLNILLDQTTQDRIKHGFFMVNKAGKVLSTQSGVVRTNCVDNLDRTNVAQSLFDRECLELQFQKIGILKENEKFTSHHSFERVFKHTWANNGDTLSVQYSGTGALKSDFTRSGKRTFRGVIDDGINSAQRYYLNNFKDGQKQDAFDLFLGKYVVDLESSPFRSGEAGPLRVIYAIIIFIGLMMLALSLLDPSDMNWMYKIGVVLFWIVALYLAWRTLLTYGQELVNRPALVKAH